MKSADKEKMGAYLKKLIEERNLERHILRQ